MVNYKNGKIYKLIVGDGCYVGATCGTLVKRKYKHKIASKTHPNQKVYKKCNEVGWKSIDIVLLEYCSCNNKDELHRTEREWIEKIGTLNTNIPTRTLKEYRLTPKFRQLNKQYQKQYRTVPKFNQWKKEYLQMNKKKIKKQQKEWRLKNIDKIKEREKKYKSRIEYKQKTKEYNKKFYLKNKEKIKKRQRENYKKNKK